MNPTSSYRPGREIARGGMGAVLDARDQKLGRSVAMKVMLRRNASEEEQQRFLQEARVLGQLAHPNIVPVHDVGTDEQGRLFYTMKLVQGVTLHDVIGKLKAGDTETLARYPLNALLTVFQKVCDAVAFAHSRGIIHRDLKPQNIMVGEFGEVLVMDWGLAKILPGSAAAEEAAKTPTVRGQFGKTGPTGTLPINSPAAEDQVTLAAGPAAEDEATMVAGAGAVEDATIVAGSGEDATAPQLRFGTPGHAAPGGVYATMEGAVMGTPHFMSPEQAEGRISDLEARSDIFSLGGILYALLTLRPPVEGESLEEILSKVRRGDITPPSTFNAGNSTQHPHHKPNGEVVEPKKIIPLQHLPDGRVPTALSAVVMKSLAVQREARYPDVAAFAADLTAYQGGFATSAENANVLTLLRLFIHRHKTLTVATALIVLLTIGFVVKLIASEDKATRNAKDARDNEKRAVANEKTAEENATKARAETKRATKAETEAVQEKESTRKALAKAALNLADAARREGNGPEMQAALDEVPEDLRDSTWHYLIALSDTSIARIRTAGREIYSVAAHPRRPGVFAVTDSSAKVSVIEVRTGVQLLEFMPGFPTASSGRKLLAFSPDGERIAVGRQGASLIVIHSARDGTKLMEWEAPGTWKLEFSPDGRLLLQTELDGKRLIAWDATTGRVRWTHESTGIEPIGTFTPDSLQVVTHDARNRVRLVKAQDGTLVRSLSNDYVSALAVRPDGKMVVIGGRNDGRIKGVMLEDGKALFEFRAHDRGIQHLAFTPEGGRFVSVAVLADGRQAIHLWDANSGAPLQTLLGGTGSVTGAGVHPLSGELLVGGSSSRAWNLTGTPEKWTLRGGDDSSIAFWGSDDVAFAADAGGHNSALQALQAGSPALLWKPPSSSHRQPSVSADGRLVAIGTPGYFSPVLLLRSPGPQPEQVATLNLSGRLTFLRLSPTGDRLAAIQGYNRAVALYDSATGQQPVKLERRDMRTFLDLGWVSGGKQLLGLATAKAERGIPGSEEWVVLWDAVSGKVVQTATNRSAMDVLTVAPDGSRFAEAGADRFVRIRDATTLAVQQEFRAHDAPITALAWHPTKPILATTSADLSIRLWNLDTGRRLEELRGPMSTPKVLAFSPSGRRLGCAGNNLHTHIWEPQSLSDQPAPPKSADGWEDLLAPLTPAIVAETGNGWRIDNGVLSSPSKGMGKKLLPLPGNYFAASYQLHLKLRRLVPKDFFYLALPVGGHRVGFYLDGMPAVGFYTGLSQVDGKSGKESPGAIRGLQVGDSETHELEVTVRQDGTKATITTTLDDQPLYEWAGAITSLNPPPGNVPLPSGVVALGTHTTDWLVSGVKVKRLDAK